MATVCFRVPRAARSLLKENQELNVEGKQKTGSVSVDVTFRVCSSNCLDMTDLPLKHQHYTVCTNAKYLSNIIRLVHVSCPVQVRLIDAGFVWTEPHSKRIKMKLTIQKEVIWLAASCLETRSL